MKTIHLLLLTLAAAALPVRADIEVNVSVKFIHDNDGPNTRPGGNIGSVAGFGQEITYGNNVLYATSRGYSLRVVEYLDITPPSPSSATASVTGGTTNAGAMVTCSNTAGLQIWMRVTGAGIPANTVVQSIVANTSFTMSNSATATAASVAISGSFPGDHWFYVPAREAKSYIETTALASQTVWRWNPNALNIYVNNSSSGQCSFVGGGGTISLGGTVGTGTVLHETGHFFDLRHTHAGDYSDQPNPPANTPPGAFTAAHLQNGDSLDETANDNPNITSQDQLSIALYGVPYNQPAAPPGAPFANATQRAVVDSAFQNVMSYHTEAVLLPDQMDRWTQMRMDCVSQFCTGRTWFLANGGNDGWSGASYGQPLATVTNALDRTSTPNDVLLLRAGTYTAPATQITTPCTLHATRGTVILTR